MKKNRKSARAIQFEQLEERNMFASIVWSGDTVTIKGSDNWHDSAVVAKSGNNVKITVTSTPTNGFVLTPSVTEKIVSASVKTINFYGYGGDDSFVNNWSNSNVTTNAWGGSGNDYLEGYDGVDNFDGGSGNDTLKGYGGNDILRGGTGNDKLYGSSGNDSLYGDSGDDTLYGGSGNDGLYGGAGADSMYGESGADRFLVMSGSKEHKDAASEDAVIYFKNGAKTWSESEIEAVDMGLRQLHHKTGNDNLLELKSGGSLTFQREQASGTANADNNSAGLIRMFDNAFASSEKAALTTVHEIGHNWDTEHSNWNNWLKLSGWQTAKPAPSVLSNFLKSGDGQWYYKKTATFARSYGTENPREDFATAWQSYFVFKHKMTNTAGVVALSSAKTSHLDSFFASLS